MVTPNKAKTALFVQKSEDKWAKKRVTFAKMRQKLPCLTLFPKKVLVAIFGITTVVDDFFSLVSVDG